MKFIKNDDSNPVELGVIQNHAGKHPFGDHFDFGLCTHACIKPHPIAHGFANLFTKRLRHAMRRRSCSDAPWLQHYDAPTLAPWRIEQSNRNPRGFTRTRRCHQKRK